ncbi:MAG: DNA alkylation repair protein [Candidatus Thorarchaeota archaeon]
MNQNVVKDLMQELKEQASPSKAEHVAKYMKTSSLRFLGIQIPQIRKTARKHIRSLPIDDLPEIIDSLWRERTFDFRLAAIEVMEKYTARGDVLTALNMISDMIDDIDTWALTDPLCTVCLGTLLIRDWSVERTIAGWRHSNNFWRRRSTVLPYLHLSKKSFYQKNYAAKVLAAMEPHLNDKEFFVGKAVAFVLRELSKREPDLVRSFIDNNRHMMTALMIREGSRKLS